MQVFNELLTFLIFTVVLKGIVAHWLAEQILKFTGKYAKTKSSRVAALWFHFMERVQGEKHEKEVTQCYYRRCATL